MSNSTSESKWIRKTCRRNRRGFQEKCAARGIECTRLKRYAIENYCSVEALKAVYDTKIPSDLSEILPNKKLEDQVGFNVKKLNREIARAMTLGDLAKTDLGTFFDRVEELCKAT